MFKTATIFLIADNLTRELLSPATLSNAIDEPTITDPDATQWSRAGIAHPDNFGHSPVFVGAEGTRVFVVQQRERVLPGKVIRTKMGEIAADVAARQGYKCGRKQMAEIKDEVIATLLPNSHIKPVDVVCMLTGHYLFIGTGSARMVDLALNVLRSVFPDNKLNLKPLSDGRKVTPWMMELLVGAQGDEFFVGESVVLKGREKSATRFKDMDLACRAVLDVVEDGMQPVEIAVKWMDRLTFNLTDHLIIKRIKFADILLKEAEEDASENAANNGTAVSMFDGTVALMAGELKNLLTDLCNQMPEEEEL